MIPMMRHMIPMMHCMIPMMHHIIPMMYHMIPMMHHIIPVMHHMICLRLFNDVNNGIVIWAVFKESNTQKLQNSFTNNNFFIVEVNFLCVCYPKPTLNLQIVNRK